MDIEFVHTYADDWCHVHVRDDAEDSWEELDDSWEISSTDDFASPRGPREGVVLEQQSAGDHFNVNVNININADVDRSSGAKRGQEVGKVKSQRVQPLRRAVVRRKKGANTTRGRKSGGKATPSVTGRPSPLSTPQALTCPSDQYLEDLTALVNAACTCHPTDDTESDSSDASSHCPSRTASPALSAVSSSSGSGSGYGESSTESLETKARKNEEDGSRLLLWNAVNSPTFTAAPLSLATGDSDQDSETTESVTSSDGSVSSEETEDVETSSGRREKEAKAKSRRSQHKRAKINLDGDVEVNDVDATEADRTPPGFARDRMANSHSHHTNDLYDDYGVAQELPEMTVDNAQSLFVTTALLLSLGLPTDMTMPPPPTKAVSNRELKKSQLRKLVSQKKQMSKQERAFKPDASRNKSAFSGGGKRR
eukprot:GFYU01000026.1.p1 GENE.GFYU01000026.1~~GFYU01000026.1.p1  ORF type:complete len:424 (-),score=141.55 GFYU01000026.1:218-1489(-)